MHLEFRFFGDGERRRERDRDLDVDFLSKDRFDLFDTLNFCLSLDTQANFMRTFLDLLLFFSERSTETDPDPSFDLDRLNIK